MDADLGSSSTRTRSPMEIQHPAPIMNLSNLESKISLQELDLPYTSVTTFSPSSGKGQGNRIFSLPYQPILLFLYFSVLLQMANVWQQHFLCFNKYRSGNGIKQNQYTNSLVSFIFLQ